MWAWLRDRRFAEYKFRRQHPVGPHILDFFCNEAKLNVEVDGFQHGLPENQASDAMRDAFLNSQGIKVLRFWGSHLKRDQEMIRDAIWRTLQDRAPHQFPDYCSPAKAISGENQTNQSFNSSPSPRPSPAGRGRMVRRQT